MKRPSGRVLLAGIACFLALVAACIPEPPPPVEMQPSSLKFAAVPGEDPPSHFISTQDERAPLLAITCPDAWVTVSPAITFPEAPHAWEVTVQVAGLAEGTHTTTLRVHHDGDLLGTVPVTLIITQDVVTPQGVVYSNTLQPIPRWLTIYFVEGTSLSEQRAVIESFGAVEVPDGDPIPWVQLVEIPIGSSLREAQEYFEADPLVESTALRLGGLAVSAGSHRLEVDGGGRYWLFRDDPSYLDYYVREWVVEVRGIQTDDNLEGAPAMDVYSVTILWENELNIHGTIDFAGPSDEYVLLVADTGDVWELTGFYADVIGDLPGIDGAGITVTGVDKGVSLDAHSGGLVMEVNWYVLD